jgi:hypothetical protein
MESKTERVVLFLDIDGVLNNWSCLSNATKHAIEWPGGHLDELNIQVLNRVLTETGAEVVLSSTWRSLIKLDELTRHLRDKGYSGPDIMEKTPDCTTWHDGWKKRDVDEQLFYAQERGFEIQEWLDTRGTDVTRFAIVDDGNDMAHLRPFLVRTSMDDGLTDDEADRLIEMLGGERCQRSSSES